MSDTGDLPNRCLARLIAGRSLQTPPPTAPVRLLPRGELALPPGLSPPPASVPHLPAAHPLRPGLPQKKGDVRPQGVGGGEKLCHSPTGRK
jgi:hypothetical protein